MTGIKTYSILSVIIILVGCIVLPITFLFVLHYNFIVSVILSAIITVIPIYLLYGYFYSKEATGKINLFYAFKVFKHLTWKDILEVFIYAVFGLIMIFYVHYVLSLIFILLILRKVKPARRKYIPKRILTEESKLESKIWKWGIIIGIIFILGLIIYLFVILG